MSRKAHAQSFMLPITVTILVPLLILALTSWMPSWLLIFPLNYLTVALSILSIVGGLFLLGSTIRMFARIGRGTLAPWDPTQKLVVHGIYRYVRNPMITGVLLILLGESILFGSVWIYMWFLFFLIGNHFYFIKSEEPGLVRKFGDEYVRYAQNVPRWIPRRTPWDSSSENA
ncbi:MAG: methyltransferase family protein [Candidatus Thorarchaeota archaeon]|jgi:protein-S-isoprenylcysteine O-methyltransferase Ste14